MLLTFDQIRKYWETRLSGQKIGTRDKVAVKCPFHDDSTASATVFLSGNGGFNCQGCSAKGNLFQFEARFSNCSLQEAEGNVGGITGAKSDRGGRNGPPSAIYDYRAPNGAICFQKRRYDPPGEKKTFTIHRPDDRGSWVTGLADDTKRVLYNLPQLVTANLVFICEGEKDCATLDAVRFWPERKELSIATTTNFEGAWQPGHSPKWLDSYSSFFSGKQVVVFEDNDESGKAWADHVCQSVYPYADSVRRVSFPDLPEKGDVTDWAETHTEDELRKKVASAPLWSPSLNPAAQRRDLFVSAGEFTEISEVEIDWLVKGVIQRGANGFFCADPKGGKSWLSLDLLISLALGVPWVGFDVPRAVKCGLVSREDQPTLTAWRIKRLFPGKMTTNVDLLEENLYINSRRQSAKLFLDCPEDVNELIREIKRRSLEVVFLDVFNVLHSADENDNTEMAKVLAQVRRIQDETGASVGIIHHFGKANVGSLTQKLRGAGAIAGFAEWLIGLSVVDEEKKIRRMEFELKADTPPEPVTFKIDSESFSGISKVVRVDYTAPVQTKRKELKLVTTK